MVIFFVLLVGLFLVAVLYGGMFVLSVKDVNIFKVSSFESGFKSVGKVQNAFSIHFFIIMLMFVVFDLEVIMMLGLVVADITVMLVFCFLFFFMLFGYLMEFIFGSLVWIS